MSEADKLYWWIETYKNNERWRIKMYEVTYSIDGIIKKLSVNADDAITAQNIITNMFGGGRIEIIEIRRV